MSQVTIDFLNQKFEFDILKSFFVSDPADLMMPKVVSFSNFFQ